LILADEPTASLDWKNGEQVLKLLESLARSEGRSVVIVTHDPRVLPFVDRALQMEDGRIVA
jgi:putative ABC transport system ATP-binding protein